MHKYFNLLRGKRWRSEAPYPGLAKSVISGGLGFAAIALLAFIHFQWQGIEAFIIPFGASAVLAYAAPTAPFSQPRNIIGGHLVAGISGLIMFNVFGHDAWWVLALANGLAIFGMVATKTVHPPAGATALLPVVSGISSARWLISPVGVGAVMIVLFAILANNVFARRGRDTRRYPVFWL